MVCKSCSLTVSKSFLSSLYCLVYWVAQMSQGYEYIYNFVDKRNWKSLKWLQFLGFEPKEEINDYGIGKMPFLLMMKEVKKIDVRSTTSPTSIDSN